MGMGSDAQFVAARLRFVAGLRGARAARVQMLALAKRRPRSGVPKSLLGCLCTYPICTTWLWRAVPVFLGYLESGSLKTYHCKAPWYIWKHSPHRTALVMIALDRGCWESPYWAMTEAETTCGRSRKVGKQNQGDVCWSSLLF